MSRVQSSRLFSVLLLPIALTLPASADDWPQWRGPDRDGKSSETGLLQNWPEGGPPVAWKAPGMGAGYSSPAIVGKRILVTGDGTEDQQLRAFSSEDGAPLWTLDIGPVHRDTYLGARSTPTVVGDRVYVVSTEGRVVAADLETGETIWTREMVADFGGDLMKAMGQYDWRYSESPLVDGKRVVVTPGGPDAAVVALDAATGEDVWSAKIPGLGEQGADGAGYSSAVVAEAAGRHQVIQLLGRGVVGLDSATGAFLWGYNRVANDIANISTPIVTGDRVFVSTAYETGAALLDLSAGEEGGVIATERYFLDHTTFQNHHGNMILHEGVVYAGHGHKKGFPIAIRLDTGDVLWGPIRNEGEGSAAVAFADGHLIFRYEDGLVVLIEATPDEYREKGSFQIPDVNQFSWAAPVIADGQLFLREQDTLWVHDLTPERPAS